MNDAIAQRVIAPGQFNFSRKTTPFLLKQKHGLATIAIRHLLYRTPKPVERLRGECGSCAGEYQS